jgi:hypothetical protein
MLEKKMGFSPCHSQSYEKFDFFRSLFSVCAPRTEGHGFTDC